MQDDRTAVKRCSRCGETKPLTAFWADHRRLDGRQTRCADCANRRRAETKRDGVPPKGPLYVLEDRGHDTPCWVWKRALTRKGYGVTVQDGRWWQAHRWCYVEHKGPIPEGLVLDHLCRNPPCVNPDHLEPVTLRENALRGKLGRLTEADVSAMRASGEGCAVISRRYGISDSHASRILRYQQWKDVPPRPKA